MRVRRWNWLEGTLALVSTRLCYLSIVFPVGAGRVEPGAAAPGSMEWDETVLALGSKNPFWSLVARSRSY